MFVCVVDSEHVVCGFVYLPVILRAFTQAWIRCACPRRSLLMIRALQRRHELIKYIEQRAEDQQRADEPDSKISPHFKAKRAAMEINHAARFTDYYSGGELMNINQLRRKLPAASSHVTT